MSVFRVIALTLLTALAVAAPSASAALYSGAGTDATGDGPAPGQDIAAVDAAYDDAGSVTASMTLAGEPTAANPMFIYLQVGTRSGTTCGPPFIALGGTTDTGTGVWGLSGDTADDFEQATVTRNGAKVTIAAAGTRLAAGAPDCVWGSLAPKATSANPSPANVDALDAPAGLAAAAPAPAPAPTPTPTPATTADVEEQAAGTGRGGDAVGGQAGGCESGRTDTGGRRHGGDQRATVADQWRASIVGFAIGQSTDRRGRASQ
ncbi:MAG TPA: hypothetical protein VNT03_15395 [Baekduia sp.]|nr:hypothetical protein [Baekduia sp.]